MCLGKRLSVADVKALLSPLDRNDVLLFCAYLNGVNETGIGPGVAWDRPEHVQRLQVLLNSLLPQVYHKKALRLAATSKPFAPLVSSALRALMKLACLWCPPTGGKHLSVRYRQNVGKVLFGLQGALVNEVPVGKADLDWIYRAFPAVTRCILANPRLDLGHDTGRLHGIIARQAVGALLEKEHDGLTVDAWFKREFQVSAKDYRRIAQGLAGYAGRFAARPQNLDFLWLDFVPFRNSFPGLEKQVQFIWEIAEATVDEVVASQTAEPTSLSEVVYDPKDVLLVKPLLGVGERHLVTSYDAVFSKFVRGLPYLAYAVAQKRGVTGGKLQMGARDPTGRIFEGYVRWLTRERFCGSDVKVFCSYQINAPQQRKGHANPEGDVLLIVGDIAYPIEVKAKVPTLADRASGDLVCLAKLVDDLSLQAATAAVALVKGECRSEDGSQIPPVQKAYPCLLVFERFPIRFPFADAFEQELSKKPNRSSIFTDSPTAGPLQVFDIDSYEDWDKAYRLPSETAQLFDALQKRATTSWLRYESLLQIREAEGRAKPTWRSHSR